MSVHTPLPWYWEEFGSPKDTAFIRSYADLQDHKVAGACQISCADAAYIVLACNSHAALVLLLESARYYVAKAGTTGAFELRDRIDAALKGAKP